MRAEDEMNETKSVRPYWDPILKNNRREYIGFITLLVERGLVTWRRRRRCSVSVFCVAKKSGMLRLVVDARLSNRAFKDTPGVSLTTSEGIADIHVDRNKRLFISKGDVANCFYRLRNEGELCEYFGMEPLHGSEVGVQELDGLPDSPQDQLFRFFFGFANGL